MKFPVCLAALTVSLAMVSTGCRYDKAAGSEDETDTTSLSDVNQDETMVDVTDGPLADLIKSGKTFEERGYKRCTDVAFEPVYFDLDATTIRASEMPKAEAVVQHLIANPDRVVSIEGNCDERGSNEYNLSLGDDRAIIISNFLAANGIARNRIETVSRGETNPAVSGSGEAAWSKNRRGEFVILKK